MRANRPVLRCGPCPRLPAPVRAHSREPWTNSVLRVAADLEQRAGADQFAEACEERSSLTPRATLPQRFAPSVNSAVLGETDEPSGMQRTSLSPLSGGLVYNFFVACKADRLTMADGARHRSQGTARATGAAAAAAIPDAAPAAPSRRCPSALGASQPARTLRWVSSTTVPAHRGGTRPSARFRRRDGASANLPPSPSQHMVRRRSGRRCDPALAQTAASSVQDMARSLHGAEPPGENV